MAEVVVTSLSLAALAALRDQLASVYHDAFSAPPYREAANEAAVWAREGLPRHATRPGFRCVVAREGAVDGPVVGFAYGYTGGPGQWWYEQVARLLGPALAAEWATNYYAVVDLAVRPAMQGRGIGGRLHDALLAEQPHRTALLSTACEETTALQLYRSRGWQTLRAGVTLAGSALPLRVMGLRLEA